MSRLHSGQALAVTAARVILGIIFFAHGWQKLVTNGMDATAAGFEAMGAPAPTFSAWLAALAELIGGGLLIVGLATPLVALILIGDMIGAIFIAHIDQPLIGGFELPLALIAGLIAVGVADQGVLSVDGNVLRLRKRKSVDAG
ncbi:DoxX family protein [Gordonia sp. VNK21]|uniref:DoxX family protein n=1 Tax=Gordonia sp. VNK21 TaxID=3382483 RepID=UPI0038D4B203